MAEPKHRLGFGTPLTEDGQTLENTEEGRVGGPKIWGKAKTRELHLSVPLAAFNFSVALVLAREI